MAGTGQAWAGAAVLSRIDGLLTAALAVIAVLVPAVLPNEIVPARLDPLRVGAPAVGLAVLLGALSRPDLAAHLKSRAAAVALGCAVVLVVLSMFFVGTIPEEGSARQDEAYLMGWASTDEAIAAAAAEGVRLEDDSRETALRRFGGAEAPFVWGAGYWLNVVAYAVAALGLVASVATALVGLAAQRAGAEAAGGPPPGAPTLPERP